MQHKIQPLFFYALSSLFAFGTVWAEGGDPEPGAGMAARLLCDGATLISGPAGLFFGFAIALYGLWQIISSENFKYGLVLIVVGALLTALPGLIRSGVSGTSGFLVSMGLSESDLTSPMNYAFNNMGNCEEGIEVDWSGYDALNPSFYQSAGIGPDGKPLPSPYNSGRPNAAGAKNGRSSGGSIDPNDARVGGAKAPGCASLVEGGSLGNRGFGMQKHPIQGGWKMHKGTDVRCGGRSGPAVYAGKGGRVTYADWSGGYGNRIEIDAGGGMLRTYSHLQGFNVRVGQNVGASDVIGSCGSTGNSTGPHLHFEIKKGEQFVDPVGAGC
jgi:hypothetical protein